MTYYENIFLNLVSQVPFAPSIFAESLLLTVSLELYRSVYFPAPLPHLDWHFFIVHHFHPPLRPISSTTSSTR